MGTAEHSLKEESDWILDNLSTVSKELPVVRNGKDGRTSTTVSTHTHTHYVQMTNQVDIPVDGQRRLRPAGKTAGRLETENVLPNSQQMYHNLYKLGVLSDLIF